MGLGANIQEKADLIWTIADKLTGVYKPHEYGEVILIVQQKYVLFGDCRKVHFIKQLMKEKGRKNEQ